MGARGTTAGMRNESDIVALQHAEMLFSIVVNIAKSVSEIKRMVRRPRCRRWVMVDWL